MNGYGPPKVKLWLMFGQGCLMICKYNKWYDVCTCPVFPVDTLWGSTWHLHHIVTKNEEAEVNDIKRFEMILTEPEKVLEIFENETKLKSLESSLGPTQPKPKDGSQSTPRRLVMRHSSKSDPRSNLINFQCSVFTVFVISGSNSAASWPDKY